MKFRASLKIAALLMTLLSSACGHQPLKHGNGVADLVFTNGRVYTVDAERSWA